MFLVQVNDNEGILKELVHVGCDLSKATDRFLATCSQQISNWDDYTPANRDAVLENGYETFGGGCVILIDTSNIENLDEDKPVGQVVHYVWKEWNEEEGRLLTPWADPREYEYAFDFMFDTPAEAKEYKVEHNEAKDEDWVLCRETLTPVGDQG